MKKLVSALLLFIVCNSCTKESSSTNNNIFENTTSHIIKVNAYLNGSINSTNSFELLANQSKQVYTSTTRGIGSVSLTFGRVKTLETDSFVVTYDNSYKIAHYRYNLEGNNPKKYLVTSIRNIYNDASYTQSITSDSKHYRVWEAKYKFTEQDYLDAKP
ncbi:MAG: hypothetical protein ABL929_10700 [Ferruginibacter sp.]